MSDSPESLVSVDLSGPDTPGTKLARVLLGAIFFIGFGLLAIACGIIAVIGPFIEDSLEGWGWPVMVAVAPFIGVAFFGLAALGFYLMRSGKKKSAAA